MHELIYLGSLLACWFIGYGIGRRDGRKSAQTRRWKLRLPTTLAEGVVAIDSIELIAPESKYHAQIIRSELRSKLGEQLAGAVAIDAAIKAARDLDDALDDALSAKALPAAKVVTGGIYESAWKAVDDLRDRQRSGNETLIDTATGRVVQKPAR